LRFLTRLIALVAASWVIAALTVGVSPAMGQSQGQALANFPYVASSALPLPESRILLPVTFSDGSLETGLAVIQADGSLDPDFGEGGVVRWPIVLLGSEEWGGQVALDRRGRILLVSTTFAGGRTRATLTRLLPNGTPDISFGANGTAVVDLGGAFSNGHSVAVEPDGDILVGGFAAPPCGGDPRAECETSPAVARLHEDGTLDRSFGHGGHRIVDTSLSITSEPSVLAMASAPSGKIVVATGHINDMEIHRLRHDGSIDRSFGQRGAVLLRQAGTGPAMYGSVSAVPELGVMPNGKIVVAGEAAVGIGSGHPYRFEMIAVRYRPDGRLDHSFGRNGKALLHFGGESFSSAFVLRKNGSMILAGHGHRAGHSYLTFASLRKNGTLDPRFGRKGLAKVGFGKGSTVIGVGLVVQGHSVVAIGNRIDQARETVLARFPYAG
jgi:uncharacterized delta-60 repeat protein